MTFVVSCGKEIFFARKSFNINDMVRANSKISDDIFIYEEEILSFNYKVSQSYVAAIFR
jgi:hypothetical protein